MSVVLVWPNAGQSESDFRDLLTDATDELVVAVWNPTAEDDDARIALLTSVRDAVELAVARGEEPFALTLVGFGRGAVAAAGIARYAKRLGIGFGRIIAVSGTWDEPDPFSGSPITEIPERVELVPSSYLLATTLRRT